MAILETLWVAKRGLCVGLVKLNEFRFHGVWTSMYNDECQI